MAYAAASCQVSPGGMDFCTLGMFIIDDIYPAKTDKTQEPHLDIVGGAGTYSAVGARLFCPPPSTHTVGWVVDAGPDFPDSVRQTITSWQTDVLLRPRNGLTTRGWNGYGDNDFRSFKYLTEKVRITERDLTDRQILSRTFHLICSASRCIDLVNGINAKRAGHDRPLFIWEPVPDLCIPEEREMIITALKYIDVFSPNHDELAALFGNTVTIDDPSTIESNAGILLAAGIGTDSGGAVVVRCGKAGCRTYTRQRSEHVEAYHKDQTRVIDPTGGGNGFLGGFGVGLARTGDVFEATNWGSIAASFCIEQVGPPVLSDGTEELWNGESVLQRLADFKQRTKR